MSAPQAGCGAAILQDGRLLLIQRLKAPEAGHWGLPGGKIEFGERARDAAIREIREELGIELSGLSLLCVVDQFGEGQHWVSPVFLCEAFAGEPAIQEPDKIAALGWFAFEALPGPLTQAAREALAALKV